MRILVAVLAAALIGVALGCGGSSDEAARTVTVTVSADEPVPAADAPATSSEGYPREVLIADIRDQRIRDSLAESGKKVAVLVAPGIYSERGSGPLGVVEDYTSVLALCVDFNQYQKAREPDPISGSCIGP